MRAVKVPNAAHEAKGWLISSLVPDFELLDVWALPVEGGADDAENALQLLADFDPVTTGPLVVRALFAVRLRLGALLRWDTAAQRPIPGCHETSLVSRLPASLLGSADDPPVTATMREAADGFVPLYRTADEWAAEISNATVHGVLHLAWTPVRRTPGRYRAHMAVYVKPRGRLGRAYLALIEPFRHLIVYPAMMRELERAWASRRPRVEEHA